MKTKSTKDRLHNSSNNVRDIKNLLLKTDFAFAVFTRLMKRQLRVSFCVYSSVKDNNFMGV